MARAVAVVLLFALAACGSVRRPASAEARQGALTLCVANESASVGTIRVYVESFRALTVHSGRRGCRQIRQVANGARLYAESIGGGLRGPVRYQGEIRSTDIRCWEWVLRDSPTSEIRLLPCD
jgi:hypothetical protein